MVGGCVCVGFHSCWQILRCVSIGVVKWKYNCGASKVYYTYSIVWGDESSFYGYEPYKRDIKIIRVWTRKKRVNASWGVSKCSKINKSCSFSKRFEANGGFFTKTGHVATLAPENLKTVNSAWYMTIYLPETFGKLKIFGHTTERMNGLSALQPRLGTQSLIFSTN